MIIPNQPFYAERFGADPTLVTLLSATYSAMQFLFAPMWGRLSDRIGRRPVILVSVAIGVVGNLMFALAGGLWVLFLARFITGVGTANFGAAQAVVADTTHGADRARGMGLLGAAFGMGFIIGPALGGVLGQISPTAPFWAATGLSLLNLALALRNLPETHPVEKRGVRPGRWFALLDVGEARRFVNVPRLLVILGVAITGMALMEQALPLLIERVWVAPTLLERTPAALEAMHKASSGRTAVLLIVVGVTSAFIQGGLIGRLNRRFGERRLVRFGSAFAALALLSMPLAADLGSFLMLAGLSGAMLAIGTATLSPSANAFLSRSVPGAEQGHWLGISQSLSALGRTIGPAVAGVLFSASATLPFFVGAGLMGLGALVALSLKPLADA